MLDSQSEAPEQRWYHIVLTVYGAWLPGDPRGFRTRNHREHIEGDYKNPPPAGKYAERYRRARESMRFNPVSLSPELRQTIGEALRDRLHRIGGFVLCMAVSAKHAHILTRITTGTAYEAMALIKRHAWFAARDQGYERKLWAAKGRANWVQNREHQLNTFRYILRHKRQGAWVWHWTATH